MGRKRQAAVGRRRRRRRRRCWLPRASCCAQAKASTPATVSHPPEGRWLAGRKAGSWGRPPSGLGAYQRSVLLRELEGTICRAIGTRDVRKGANGRTSAPLATICHHRASFASGQRCSYTQAFIYIFAGNRDLRSRPTRRGRPRLQHRRPLPARCIRRWRAGMMRRRVPRSSVRLACGTAAGRLMRRCAELHGACCCSCPRTACRTCAVRCSGLGTKQLGPHRCRRRRRRLRPADGGPAPVPPTLQWATSATT